MDRGTAHARVAIATLLLAMPAFAQADTDVERALAVVRVDAAAGNRVAQFALGQLLYYGSAETLQAASWIRQSAAQDYPPAECQMGQLYDFGFGVAQDDREALAWYRKAADHGSAAAQRAVADFYKRGRGVAADLKEAARWYRRAADGDDLRAQYELGQLYFDGTGVARDYVSAYIWFTVAAGQTPLVDNRRQLIELRNIAAVRMTAAQATDAARRAANWKPAPAK